MEHPLTKLRKQAEWSYFDLQAASGVSSTTLVNIEVHGKSALETTWQKLAKAFSEKLDLDYDVVLLELIKGKQPERELEAA